MSSGEAGLPLSPEQKLRGASETKGSGGLLTPQEENQGGKEKKKGINCLGTIALNQNENEYMEKWGKTEGAPGP